MKLAISIITVVAGALLAVACSSSRAADPRSLAPASATFIGEARVADILRDPDLATLYDVAPKGAEAPQTLQELLASGSLKAGMDLRTIQTAVVFGEAARPKEYAGAILQGSFDPEVLRAALNKASPGATETKYKDIQVFVSTEGGDTTAYAMLSRELVVVGTLPSVHSVIDVHNGDQKPMSGRVWETFQSLGTPMFRLAAELPKQGLGGPGADLGDLPGLGALPLGAETLDALEVVGVALDKAAQNLSLHAQLDFRDAGSADQMEGMLSGGLSLLRGFSSDRQLRDLLDQVQVTLSGARVDVRLRVSVADLQALAAKPGLLP